MSIQLRPYNRSEDYEKVCELLLETYVDGGQYPNWLQPRWEYMHFHPNFDTSSLDKIGIWEDENKIVAVANYEDNLGDVFFAVHKDYEYLKKEMLSYAEHNLYAKTEDGKRYVRAFINDFDVRFTRIANSYGFEKDDRYSEYRAISQYSIPKPFPEITLPQGFKLKSLEEDNDFHKINRVLWRGFNHAGEPPEEEIAGRKLMQSAPGFKKNLNVVVEAPDGNFVSYCGMWLLPDDQVAYVEPVATDPDYRQMGLGRVAVLEGIRRCGEMGAQVVFVETGMEFYRKIGFRVVFYRYPWIKYLD